jgi:hypothetical protein
MKQAYVVCEGIGWEKRNNEEPIIEAILVHRKEQHIQDSEVRLMYRMIEDLNSCSDFDAEGEMHLVLNVSNLNKTIIM